MFSRCPNNVFHPRPAQPCTMLTGVAGQLAKQYLSLARAFVRILEASITEEASCRVLLLPEMVERIAEMLNYFLDLLVGKQRQQLKVRCPDVSGAVVFTTWKRFANSRSVNVLVLMASQFVVMVLSSTSAEGLWGVV